MVAHTDGAVNPLQDKLIAGARHPGCSSSISLRLRLGAALHVELNLIGRVAALLHLLTAENGTLLTGWHLAVQVRFRG